MNEERPAIADLYSCTSDVLLDYDALHADERLTVVAETGNTEEINACRYLTAIPAVLLSRKCIDRGAKQIEHLDRSGFAAMDLNAHNACAGIW